MTGRSFWITSVRRMDSSNMAWRSWFVKAGKRSRSTELWFSKWRKSSQLPPNSVGEAARPVILQHAPGLLDQDRRFDEIARIRVSQQFLVGHAGPKKEAEPAGERVGGDGAARHAPG